MVIAAIIFFLRKVLRIGIPVMAPCLSLMAFMRITGLGYSWFRYPVNFLFCAAPSVVVISIFVLWLDTDWKHQRQVSAEAVKAVFKHVKERKERKLLETKGLAGAEPPTIYDHAKTSTSESIEHN